MDTYVTVDGAVARPDTATDGIDVVDGETEIEWSQVDTVTVDSPPHTEAFETRTFYDIPYTVAKAIPQPYNVGDSDEAVWLQKPAGELRKAAWSLDNKPFTLGHPDGNGMVKDVTDIHGFWTDTSYDGQVDELRSRLRLPVTDEEAKDFIEENSDVSVGFRNRLQSTDAYDGEVDSEADLQGVQTDMLFDHAAAVAVGRCSSSDGCGINIESEEHQSVGVTPTPDTARTSMHDNVTIHGRTQQVDTVETAGIAILDESDMDLSVPESAQSAAQNFLDAVEAGKVPEDCGGPDGLGRRRADQFAEGGDLSLETWVTGGTSAVANWHARHGGNEDYNESEVDTPWEDCGYAMFKAWGGASARDKAMSLKSQHNNDESDEYNVGDTVEWEDGAAEGEVIDKKTDGCFSDRIDGDVEVCAGDGVVYLIEEDDGKTVAHKGGTLSMTDATALLNRKEMTRDEGHMKDGTWYAIKPDENPDDEHKYEIDNCSDVQDAWHLRAHGDYSIEQSTLESRIQERAKDLDCDVPGESMMDVATCCTSHTKCEAHGDYPITRNSDSNDTMEFDINMDDLSAEVALDKLAAEYDGIEDHLDGLKTRADAATEAADELDTDVTELAETVGMVADENDDLREQVDDLLEPKKEELVSEITDATDRFGDAESLMEEDLDTLEDHVDMIEEFTSEATDTTANADGGDEPVVTYDGYVSNPWD